MDNELSHFDGQRYFNVEAPPYGARVWHVLRWMATRRPSRRLMRVAHMNAEEAVQAHLDLTPRLSIGMHFGTFQLTDEAIDEPIKELGGNLQKHGVKESEFRVPAFGETIVMD